MGKLNQQSSDNLNQLKWQLDEMREKHHTELRDYAEHYFDACLDSFPKRVPFSSHKRNLRKMGVALRLACGEAALASGDKTLQREFLESAKKAGILKPQKKIVF